MQSNKPSHPSHPLAPSGNKENIARDGAPKRTATTTIHNGFKQSNRDGSNLLGHPVSYNDAPDASSGNPMATPPAPSHKSSVSIHPSMVRGPDHSQLHAEQGRTVLAEARVGDPQHPQRMALRKQVQRASTRGVKR